MSGFVLSHVGESNTWSTHFLDYGRFARKTREGVDRIKIEGSGQRAIEHAETAPALATPQNDSLNYLVAVLQHRLEPKGDLTSLDTNVAVVRILDAARKSAQTGKAVPLSAAVTDRAAR